MLDYQWSEVLIPYWKETVKYAKKHGISKIALEAHPGFCVYNPETLLKLREAVGEEIGSNFDPSHLIWQGIDPYEAILMLGKAIFHVHAKDTFVNDRIVRQTGNVPVPVRLLSRSSTSKTNRRFWIGRYRRPQPICIPFRLHIQILYCRQK